MFPTLKTTVSGLDPEKKYYILLDLMLADDCRYKFTGKEWTVAGKAEPQMPPRFFIHPDSPATGATWMKHDISYQKVKLTNNNLDQNGHIILTSMHKYVARVHVVQCNDLVELQFTHYNTFVFPQTTFLGVTAYQNEKVTQLKIDNNPFAKGFRENGQLRSKRKGSSDFDSENSVKRQRNGSGNSSDHDLTVDNANDDVFANVGKVEQNHPHSPVSHLSHTNNSPMMKKLELEANRDRVLSDPSLFSSSMSSLYAQSPLFPPPHPGLPGLGLGGPCAPPPPPPAPFPSFPSPSLYYHQMLAARYQLLQQHYSSLHYPNTSLAMPLPRHPGLPPALGSVSGSTVPTPLSPTTPTTSSSSVDIKLSRTPSPELSRFFSDYYASSVHTPTTPSTPSDSNLKPAFPFSPSTLGAFAAAGASPIKR